MTVRPAADEDYLALLRERGPAAVLAQMPAALIGLLRVPFALASGGFGFLAVGVALMALLGRRTRGARHRSLPSPWLLAYLCTAPLLVYAIAFAARPFESVEGHLSTASTRLWMHVVGPFFLLLARLTISGDQPSNPSRPRW